MNARQLNALSRRAGALLVSARNLPPSRIPDARRWAGEAAVLAEQARNPLLEAEAWLVAGSLAGPMALPSELLEPLRRAEQVFAAYGDSLGVARSQVRQAMTLRDMGLEQQAMQAAERSLGAGTLGVVDQVLAHVCLALCTLHSGDFASCWNRLSAVAEPLARVAKEPSALASVLWAQALTQLLLLVARHSPELWLELPIAPVPTDLHATAAAISAKLDDAERLDGIAGFRLHLELCRCASLVLLNRDRVAASRIASLASNAVEHDVALSLLAEFVLALHARSEGRLREALLLFAHLRRRAERFGQTSLLRDICLQQSRLHEALDDPVSALAFFKEHAELVSRSLRPQVPNADPLMLQPMAPAAGPTADLPTAHLRRLEPAHVRRAAQFINERLWSKLDVAMVTRDTGVSRRSLEVAFRDFRSMTIGDYITRQRMNHAANLLCDTSMALDAVALAVGYRSASAFARAFQARHGATPAAWRRAGRQSTVGS